MISGSIAELSIIVSPSVIDAIIMMFSVAPTEGKSKYIFPPTSLSTSASILPCSVFTSTPRALKPFKCKSTGLVPIAQPPGSDVLLLPSLANNGPITRNDALILFTRSYLVI